MKRISTLLLSAAMAFGAMGAAEAVELKASGFFDFAFGHVDSETFKDSNAGKGEDTFMAKQRVRTQFNFIASENLQGVVMFEIGDHLWGQSQTHGSTTNNAARLDADGVNIETKRAYMDWVIPNTGSSIRMGIQGLALPTATGFGNPVFNADVAGIVNTNKVTDMVDVTAFWLRPFDQASNDGLNVYDNANNNADEMDMFGLVVPVKGDGWKVTPWAMYANIGNASGFYQYITTNTVIPSATTAAETTGAWWIGTALNFQIIDNLSFATDIMYGKLNSVDIGTQTRGVNTFSNDFEASGWWADAALNYKIENLGTAGLFGWYSTGDGKHDGNELGRMPVVGVDGAVSFTSFGFAGSSNAFGTDNIVSSTATGTWGLGVKLADVSFVDKLSHTLRFAYYEGTNNKNSDYATSFKSDPQYLTTRDNAFEVNFDHKYQIYENLSTHLDLGYVTLDKQNDSANAPDDAWKAQVLFRYAF